MNVVEIKLIHLHGINNLGILIIQHYNNMFMMDKH